MKLDKYINFNKLYKISQSNSNQQKESYRENRN